MLKKRELEHGIELSTFCVQLKLQSQDGKSYETDCSDTKALFRIIPSIPSRKAEPFKQWLAQVGYERVQEIDDPELAQNAKLFQHPLPNRLYSYLLAIRCKFIVLI
jgi:DNA-damage-inducible protein D